MNKIRWGLLSTADINRRLIPALQNSPRGELVAVASRSQAAADEYAAKWQIAKAFGSYEAMLNSGEIDAVYIPLPNHLHAEWSIKAMQAGVHVLCEKPFAITLAEVDQMTTVAQQTGRVLAEAFMYRHHPQTKVMGEWVRSGKLGEVIAVNSTFNFSLTDRSNVRFNPDWGGGCLWDVGVYPISLAQFVFGEAPTQVFGQARWGETGIDEFFCGQLQYPGNRLAQITCSFSTPFYESAVIIGTQGRLVTQRPFVFAVDDFPTHLEFVPNEGEPHTIEIPQEYLYQGEVEDMHAAILDGGANYLSLAETRNHVRTALALLESARSGTVATL